jgi:hypothetical protein
VPSWPFVDGPSRAPRVGYWTVQPIEIVSEFKPEQGPERTRRKTTGTKHLCTGSFLVSKANRTALEAFWRDDCRRGSLTFTMRDPDHRPTIRTWEWRERPTFSHLSADQFIASVSLIRL